MLRHLPQSTADEHHTLLTRPDWHGDSMYACQILWVSNRNAAASALDTRNSPHVGAAWLHAMHGDGAQAPAGAPTREAKERYV